MGQTTISTILLAAFMATTAVAADLSQQKYPDVVSAKVQPRGADIFDFDVTVSSPYDTPQRYADGFRVTGRDGTVFGERKLWHDHAGEQPFSRQREREPKPVRRDPHGSRMNQLSQAPV